MTAPSVSFLASARKADGWFFAGLASTFPDYTQSGGDALNEQRLCENGEPLPGCKVFQVPLDDASRAEQIEGDEMVSYSGTALKDQVLIFQYRGKIHAIDNKCPHSAFPLAMATPFDIEDFGIILSAGITCPKHGWSFDLFTGNADRSSYKLRTWEVQLRPADNTKSETTSNESQAVARDKQEVWIRRRQRMG
ncbi:hypothetical protein F4808DRAFT_110056 [Astrocystis sublimbata]|nr:hypothetical protein F4808DRAFT_110056 [Astrocystis sublimbata]